jgi:hypothetical protein
MFGTAYIGELHVSRRMPDGEVTSTFEPISNEPYIMCIGCMVLISEHELDLWPEAINEVGECQECTHIRCWRWDDCKCPCHDEE